MLVLNTANALPKNEQQVYGLTKALYSLVYVYGWRDGLAWPAGTNTKLILSFFFSFLLVATQNSSHQSCSLCREPESVFKTPYFLRNLQLGPIN